MPRIVRVPIYHEATFHAILSAANQAQSCLCYRGESWEPVEMGRSFSLYRLAPTGLRRIQERVDRYELFFYSRLLEERFGSDGVLRPATRLRRGPNGALRAAPPAGQFGAGDAPRRARA